MEKITFTNHEGLQLSGRLELPDDQPPHTFAIFAHCFTCNKNLTAVRNISRALVKEGFAVFRFDFTGLGESEGDFADTSFSSNVEDLAAAFEHLSEKYEAPKMLIGHSLGGAAVVFAAHRLPDIKAIVTIGAPADPEHVTHLFDDALEVIEEEGKAKVNIGGRPFTIKKKFIDDLKDRGAHQVAKELRRPILIMHSPQDTTVGVENAKLLYQHAHHPKSFVSLDGADHLLTQKEDSLYAGDVIAAWVKRYIEIPEATGPKTRHQVAASTGQEAFTTHITAGQHHLIADEPLEVGGHEYGPSPYGYLTAGLAACTSMTLQMYAKRKNWDLQHAVVHIDHAKDYWADCENMEDPKSKIDHFVREIELIGNLDDDQRKRLLEIADRCPVHKTLHSEVKVVTTEKR